MKRIIALASAFLLVTPLLAVAATNDLTALVRNGLFEEEANHNLDAAIQSYQTAIAGFDQDRQLAATAIFRLGECYRKLGRTNEANAQYSRILREFPDQSQLATLSHAYFSPSEVLNVVTNSSSRPESSDEGEELARIANLFKNSPDLVDTPALLANAVRKEWVSVTEYLLDGRANPNGRLGDGWTALGIAADTGNLQMVKILLLHGDTNVNGGLYIAARHGFNMLAKELLNKKADPNHRFDHGNFALQAAADSGHVSTAQLLLKNGADINETNDSGRTALFTAIERNNREMATFLLTNGAEVNLLDAQGLIPLELAQNDDMRELLRKFGADDEQERLGGIFIHIKGSAGLGNIVFSKSDDPGEPHSLFEVLGEYYGICWAADTASFHYITPLPYGDPEGDAIRRRHPQYSPLRFPDFKRVLIDRVNGTNREQITVDFDAIITAGDCSQNTPLQWGDVVELSPLDHPLKEAWNLPDTTKATLAHCLQRTVQIVIKGETNELKLQPGYAGEINTQGLIFAKDLDTVVKRCDLLLLSSDLSHVNVLRPGNAPRVFVLQTDGSSYRNPGFVFTANQRPTPWFILHDGDTILIPDK